VGVQSELNMARMQIKRQCIKNPSFIVLFVSALRQRYQCSPIHKLMNE